MHMCDGPTLTCLITYRKYMYTSVQRAPSPNLVEEAIIHDSNEVDLDEITPSVIRALNLENQDPQQRFAALRALTTGDSSIPERYEDLSSPSLSEIMYVAINFFIEIEIILWICTCINMHILVFFFWVGGVIACYIVVIFPIHKTIYLPIDFHAPWQQPIRRNQ